MLRNLVRKVFQVTDIDSARLLYTKDLAVMSIFEHVGIIKALNETHGPYLHWMPLEIYSH